MKRAVLVFHILLAVVLIGGGISFLAFSYGVAHGTSQIQASCDDTKQEKTVINGHEYLCGDYVSVMQAIARAVAQGPQRGA